MVGWENVFGRLGKLLGDKTDLYVSTSPAGGVSR